MSGLKPATAAEKRQIRDLHAKGLGRNEIMRETGIHAKRVSMIAASLGLTFSRRGMVAEATEARKADAASRRARLQVDSLEAAEKLLGQMFAEALVYNFGGKDNTFKQRKLNEPSFADKRSIAVAIQSLVGSSVRIAEFERAASTGVDDGKTMLGALAAGLGDAYAALQQAEAAADAAES